MEAFILADKVLAKTHMEPNSQVQLKYLKKYDLPPSVSCSHPTSNTIKSSSVMNRSHAKRSQPLNMNKTKHLLSSLFDHNITAPVQPLRKNNLAVRKYFTLSSDYSGSGHVKKGRNLLLVKKVEPQAQQYDTNIGFVTRRTPSWGFNPVHRMKI
jgi:hypothetical protein